MIKTWLRHIKFRSLCELPPLLFDLTLHAHNNMPSPPLPRICFRIMWIRGAPNASSQQLRISLKCWLFRCSVCSVYWLGGTLTGRWSVRLTCLLNANAFFRLSPSPPPLSPVPHLLVKTLRYTTLGSWWLLQSVVPYPVYVAVDHSRLEMGILSKDP